MRAGRRASAARRGRFRLVAADPRIVATPISVAVAKEPMAAAVEEKGVRPEVVSMVETLGDGATKGSRMSRPSRKERRFTERNEQACGPTTACT